MQFNNISYPIHITNWTILNGGYTMNADYETWDSDQNEPYAGGFALVVFNGGNGTNNWNVIWVGPNQLALQATDTGLYAAVSQQMWAPLLGLTDGSQDDQNSNTSITWNSTYSLVNLGSGNVAIQLNGQSLSFRWNDNSWSDWGFQIIQPESGIGQWETLAVTGTQFPILLISQSGAGLNLTGQDLSSGGYINSIAGVDFTGANLTNAVIASLPNRDVTGTNFTNCTLSGANMGDVLNLNKATWTSATLINTNLSAVDTGGTQGVNFTGATLNGATLSNGQPIASNYNYSGANFTNAHLNGATLNNVSFAGANFTNATLTGANLTGADLTGAILTGADFTGATLAGTNLTGASLGGAIFNSCDLSSTNFGSNPIFGGSAATRTLFQNAINVPAPSLGLNWSYIDLTGANVTDIPTSAPGLSGLVAINTLFPTSIGFGSVTLTGANLTDAQLYYADFTAADLGNATLNGAQLKGAKLNGANLSGASLVGTWLIAENGGSDPNQYEAAQAASAFFINTVMDQVQAAGVDFSGSLFVTDTALSSTQASAQGAFMVRSSFTDATVVGVNFRGTQFSGAQFANANLIGSLFPSTTLNPTSDTEHSVPSMHNANITGTQFADSEGGVITNAANMDGLEMQGATFSTTSGVYEPTSFTDYYGKPVFIYVSYQPTLLGTTTSSTTCPNGNDGPCSL